MYSFHRFKALPAPLQLSQLNKEGIALGLAYILKSVETTLFAYHDFYVELIVARYTQEIIAIKPFKSMKRLEPFLNQVDIGEINILLLHNK